MATSEEWIALAERLYAKGTCIFDGAEVMESEEGTADPRVVALALLARTLSNFQAAILLLDNNHLVEARAITRCCYENFFWLTSLARRGKEFVAEMKLDDASSRMRRAKDLLNWSKKQTHETSFADTLASFSDLLKQEHGNAALIQQKQAAKDGGVGDAYIFYAELSNDAAHPSATSLSRHVQWHDGDGPQYSVLADPKVDHREREDTLELLCSVMLGVCVGADEVLGGVEGGDTLFALAAIFRAASASNNVARNVG